LQIILPFGSGLIGKCENDIEIHPGEIQSADVLHRLIGLFYFAAAINPSKCFGIEALHTHADARHSARSQSCQFFRFAGGNMRSGLPTERKKMRYWAHKSSDCFKYLFQLLRGKRGGSATADVDAQDSLSPKPA